MKFSLTGFQLVEKLGMGVVKGVGVGGGRRMFIQTLGKVNLKIIASFKQPDQEQHDHHFHLTSYLNPPSYLRMVKPSWRLLLVNIWTRVASPTLQAVNSTTSSSARTAAPQLHRRDPSHRL